MPDWDIVLPLAIAAAADAERLVDATALAVKSLVVLFVFVLAARTLSQALRGVARREPL